MELDYGYIRENRHTGTKKNNPHDKGNKCDEMIRLIREGDEEVMCSSFERILNNEKAEGKAESVIELLEDIGTPSETLWEYIMKQTDLEVLRKWLKAAGAETIEDFRQAIGFIQT